MPCAAWLPVVGKMFGNPPNTSQIACHSRDLPLDSVALAGVCLAFHCAYGAVMRPNTFSRGLYQRFCKCGCMMVTRKRSVVCCSLALRVPLRPTWRQGGQPRLLAHVHPCFQPHSNSSLEDTMCWSRSALGSRQTQQSYWHEFYGGMMRGSSSTGAFRHGCTTAAPSIGCGSCKTAHESI